MFYIVASRVGYLELLVTTSCAAQLVTSRVGYL